MGSPYVDVRVLLDTLAYRRGAVLRVTAGQAHLWSRMGVAEPLVEEATARPPENSEAADGRPRRGRRGRRSAPARQPGEGTLGPSPAGAPRAPRIASTGRPRPVDLPAPPGGVRPGDGTPGAPEAILVGSPPSLTEAAADGLPQRSV